MLPAGNVGAHRARHGDHDAHAQGLQLEAQAAGPDVDGALGGGVDGAEEVGDLGGDGGDVDDEAAGLDEEGDEGLDDKDGAEDVGLVGLADVVNFGVQGWDGVCSASGCIVSLRREPESNAGRGSLTRC